MSGVATSEAGARARRGWPPSRVALWALAGLAGVVLVVAAVAGALREPADLDPDTPEGVVQDYLEAVLARDHDAAVAHLSEADADHCGAEGFQRAYVPEALTATLDEVRLRGDRADVLVRLREPTGPPPFGGPGMRSTEAFELVRDGGAWRLTGRPWPLHWCPEAS